MKRELVSRMAEWQRRAWAACPCSTHTHVVDLEVCVDVVGGAAGARDMPARSIADALVDAIRVNTSPACRIRNAHRRKA